MQSGKSLKGALKDDVKAGGCILPAFFNACPGDSVLQIFRLNGRIKYNTFR
jgi:hypothetical protein